MFHTHAEFSMVNHIIDEIRFNSPNGVGRVNGISFDIEHDQDKLIFTPQIAGADEIIWDNMPALLSELDEFVIQSAQISSMPNEAKISVNLLRGSGADSEVHIEDFLFSCLNSMNYEDPYEEMIDSCTTNSRLEWDKFESSIPATAANSTQGLKIAQAASNLFQTNKALDQINISNVKLRIEENRLGGFFRMPVKGKVRKIDVKGNVKYDGNQKMVRVKFDWIKYFFVTVTDDFFKELEQLESPSFVVQKPYIYIYLDK
jgi:hypothetical protein